MKKKTVLSRRSMLHLTGLSVLGCMAGSSTNKNRFNNNTGFQGELQKRIIPSSGEKIPVVGLGTWRTFDVSTEGEELKPLRDVLSLLVSKGASIIDSSPMYGSSEKVVGHLSTELGIRNKLFLATKVWTSGREPGISQMEESFRKMKTKVMDLMQVHNLVDVNTHLETLRNWKDQGKIRYIGITHYTTGAYPELMRLIKNEKLDFVQFNYNIMARDAEAELLPLAKEKGVAVIINRPFEEGALFNKVKGLSLPPWAANYHIYSWAQFFLKFILSHPAVTCTIPGTSKATHLEDNLTAGTGRMPDEHGRQKMINYFKSL